MGGLDGLEQALYAKVKDDPRLVTFVAHVPTLGAREEHVGPASQVIKNAHTRNYWEETGAIGKRMQEALKADVYIWDFWAIYEPDARWSDAQHVPAPSFWQHQLRGRLPADRLLNPTDFAAHVDALLARLPR